MILCDIGLPEVDGYQVVRSIRQDPVLSATFNGRPHRLRPRGGPETRHRGRLRPPPDQTCRFRHPATPAGSRLCLRKPHGLTTPPWSEDDMRQEAGIACGHIPHGDGIAATKSITTSPTA
ncbi:MAG: hypothetical protein WDN06_05335 [Asticcacaulis sp.]